MRDVTIQELYTLDETIAKEIFEGRTYPWEVLPCIKDFILKLGGTLSPKSMTESGRTSGSRRMRRSLQPLPSTGLRSSERARKSASARLSAEMPLWARVLWWEIPQS